MSHAQCSHKGSLVIKLSKLKNEAASAATAAGTAVAAGGA